jgi:NAD+ synthase (glutamine-hydrolysing)
LEKLPENHRNDLVFENVQARMRTMLLMNRGFVLGTGDMSEQALGWSTYNADHMSMYNVNGSIPKTLVKFLIRYVAEYLVKDAVGKILIDIVQTPITPELLPLSSDQNVLQSTEDTIGPYELHDFFLYHLVRGGATPSKILLLAEHTVFDREYSPDQIRSTLKVFLKRFFASQYKRSCVPDGPKVGSVSLSPRGDWRMPSDADVATWIAEL